MRIIDYLGILEPRHEETEDYARNLDVLNPHPEVDGIEAVTTIPETAVNNEEEAVKYAR